MNKLAMPWTHMVFIIASVAAVGFLGYSQNWAPAAVLSALMGLWSYMQNPGGGAPPPPPAVQP